MRLINRTSVLFLSLGIAALFVAVIYGHSTYSAFAFGFASFVVGISFAFGAREFDIFEPRFFVGFSFSIFYGIGSVGPILAAQKGLGVPAFYLVEPFVPMAAMLAYLCFGGIILGYELAFKKPQSRLRFLFSWKERNTSALLLTFVVVGLCAVALKFVSGILYQSNTELATPIVYRTIGLLQSFGLAAIVLLTIKSSMANGLTWRPLAIGFFLIFLLVSVVSGSKASIFLTVSYAAIGWNYCRGLISRAGARRTVIVSITLLLSFVPVNNFYRAKTADFSEISISGSLDAFGSAFSAIATEEEGVIYSQILGYAAGRFSNTIVVAHILQAQDNGLELAMGSTYGLILWAPIPRFIWPDKPHISIGNFFYRNIMGGSSDGTTSVGITLIGEMVYNFGIYVAPFFAILIGILFAKIYISFRRAIYTSPLIAPAIYAICWRGLIVGTLESNFAGAINGLFVDFILVAAIFLLLGIKPIRKRNNQPA